MVAACSKALLPTDGDPARVQQVAKVLPPRRGVEAFQTCAETKHSTSAHAIKFRQHLCFMGSELAYAETI